jgi:hypothetical protein
MMFFFRRRKTLIALARSGGLAIALVAGIVFAQSTLPPGLGREKSAEVSDSDKIKHSSQALKRMREVMTDVFTKLKEARDSHDVVKAACVNESLTQIKALVRISEQADLSLQEAISTRNTTRAEDEYTKLTIAPGKVEEQRAKSEECMGELAFQTIGLTVEVEEPKGLPQNDLTHPPSPSPVLTRPPPASPTL